MAASESSVRVQEALSGESATSEAMAADAGLAGAEDAAASATASPSGAYILAGLAVLLAAAAWRWRLASLPGGIGPRRRILPSAGCLLIGAMLVAGAIGSGFGAAAAPSGDLPAMAAAMAGLVGGQLVLLPLVAAAFRSNRFAEASSAASLPAGRAIAIGVLAMVAAYPAIATLGNGLQLLQTSLLGDERSRIAHETLAAMVSQPASLWTAAMMLLVVVGVPLCEEIAYRGLLQPAIGGLFPWLGRRARSGAGWACLSASAWSSDGPTNAPAASGRRSRGMPSSTPATSPLPPRRRRPPRPGVHEASSIGVPGEGSVTLAMPPSRSLAATALRAASLPWLRMTSRGGVGPLRLQAIRSSAEAWPE